MLNPVEESYVARFVEEEGLMNAVKKALKLGISDMLPVVKTTDTDEILGQRTRAFNTACELLDTVFRDMVKYKDTKKEKNIKNLER